MFLRVFKAFPSLFSITRPKGAKAQVLGGTTLPSSRRVGSLGGGGKGQTRQRVRRLGLNSILCRRSIQLPFIHSPISGLP